MLKIPAYESSKKIFIDLDGVLVDFYTPALQPYGVTPDQLFQSGRYLVHEMIGKTEQEFWGSVNHETFWKDLPPSSDFRQIINLSEQCVEKENVFLLTKPRKESGHCVLGKVLWVEKHLPEFLDRLIVCRNKRSCASSKSLLIDDNTHETDPWTEEGGYAVLYPRPWNERKEEATMALQILRIELEQFLIQSEYGG